MEGSPINNVWILLRQLAYGVAPIIVNNSASFIYYGRESDGSKLSHNNFYLALSVIDSDNLLKYFTTAEDKLVISI